MKYKKFIQEIKDTFKEGTKLVESKNRDYANSNDPFQNFRNSLLVGVPIDRAILVRITDKLARISNLLDKDASVKDESIADSILDGINYLAILRVYLKNKN